MTYLLYIFAVIAIPFNDIGGLAFLRELSSELSVYIFLPAIATLLLAKAPLSPHARPTTRRSVSPLFIRCLAFSMIVLFLSFTANALSIFHASFHGRSGIEKFFTSTAVVLYGFSIAYLTHILTRIYDIKSLVIRPVMISVWLCAFFGLIEFSAGTFGGFLLSLQSALSSIIHSADSTTSTTIVSWWGTLNRMRSICSEPPFLASFGGFAFPWVYAAYTSSTRLKKVTSFLGLVTIILLILAANSRTSLVLLTGNIFVLILLKTVYLPQKIRIKEISLVTLALKSAVVLGVALLLFNIAPLIDYLSRAGMSTEREVSNISRLASNIAAYQLFLERPFFGFGFGQYSFNATEHIPNWGWYSYEMVNWFTNPDAPWPPVFSVFSRFAAELGAVGLLSWIGLWYYLARTCLKLTVAYRKAYGVETPLEAIPLIVSCYAVLFFGIPADTLRAPFIWITLGACCTYIEKMRAHLNAKPSVALA